MQIRNLYLTIAASTLLALAACNRHADNSPAQANDTPAPASSTGSAMAAVDDTVVTTKVKAALLAESSLKSGDIKVTTNQGTVSLSGTVDTAEQKAHAGEITKGVSGVSAVDNQLAAKG